MPVVRSFFVAKTKLYLVVSEQLEDVIDLDGYGNGPTEPYCQVEVVAAKSREQARWQVYQEYKWYDGGDPQQMPRYYTRVLRDTDLPLGLHPEMMDQVPAQVWGTLP